MQQKNLSTSLLLCTTAFPTSLRLFGHELDFFFSAAVAVKPQIAPEASVLPRGFEEARQEKAAH